MSNSQLRGLAYLLGAEEVREEVEHSANFTDEDVEYVASLDDAALVSAIEKVNPDWNWDDPGLSDYLASEISRACKEVANYLLDTRS